MQTRFIRSFYLLAALALAWVGGIVLLNLGYLGPSIRGETERMGQAVAGRWLMEANSFLNERRGRMLRASRNWGTGIDYERDARGGDDSHQFPASPTGSLAGGCITSIAICDSKGVVSHAWRVRESGRLIDEPLLPAGTDLGDSPIFRAKPKLYWE